MARKIDFSKPLSAEDQAYVTDRPWLLQDARLRGEDIQFADDDFTVDDDNTDPETTPAGAPGVQVVDRADDASEDDESDEDDTDDEDSTEGDEDESEDGEDDEDEVAPYDEWDYQELKDEAKRRELSAGGSKEQLVKRLQDDDASAQE